MTDFPATTDSTPGSGDGFLTLAPGVVVPRDAVTLSYTASRGPGGQNVNKRATQAELRVAMAAIPLDPGARARLAALLGRRLTAAGDILITSAEHRSQAQNRGECLERLRELLVRAMARPKPRRRTRPSRGSVERRLEAKRTRADIKHSRRRVD